MADQPENLPPNPFTKIRVRYLVAAHAVALFSAAGLYRYIHFASRAEASCVVHIFYNLLELAICYVYISGIREIDWPKFFRPEVFRNRLLVCITAALIICFVDVFALDLMNHYFPEWHYKSFPWLKLVGTAEGSFALSILSFVSMVLLGPITEEITFRGFLLNRLCLKWGFAPAAVVTSLLFTAMHYSEPQAYPQRLFFSLVVSAVYAGSGSLLLAIGIHSLNNFLSWSAGFGSGAWMHLLTAWVRRRTWGDVDLLLIVSALTAALAIFYLKSIWPKYPKVIPYLQNESGESACLSESDSRLPIADS